MKATILLQRQHRIAERLFGKLERAKDDGAAEALSELADALAAHMAIEEQIFYPAVRSSMLRRRGAKANGAAKRGEDLVLESFEEHAVARFELKRLVATAPTDETFHAKLKALKELILDHVEEEEDELFPMVEKVMSDGELRALGAELEQMNAECMSVGHGMLLAPARVARAKKRRAAPRAFAR